MQVPNRNSGREKNYPLSHKFAAIFFSSSVINFWKLWVLFRTPCTFISSFPFRFSLFSQLVQFIVLDFVIYQIVALIFFFLWLMHFYALIITDIKTRSLGSRLAWRNWRKCKKQAFNSTELINLLSKAIMCKLMQLMYIIYPCLKHFIVLCIYICCVHNFIYNSLFS